MYEITAGIRNRWGKLNQQLAAERTVCLPTIRHLSGAPNLFSKYIFNHLSLSAASLQVRRWLLFRGSPSPQPCRGWVLWRWPVGDTQLLLSSKDPQRWWPASAAQKLVRDLSLILLEYYSNICIVCLCYCLNPQLGDRMFGIQSIFSLWHFHSITHTHIINNPQF